MLDAAMLARVSECYVAAAFTDEEKEYNFGGKDMVIIGDLMQLPPVSEWRNVKPFYDDMVKNTFVVGGDSARSQVIVSCCTGGP